VERPDLPVAELNQAASSILDMVGTSVVSDTYDNLKGSGDLRLIRDQELKYRLAKFFADAQIIYVVGNTHEMQLVGVFQPYVAEHLDYFAIFSPSPVRTDALPERLRAAMPAAFEQDRVLKVLPTAEFRNVLAILVARLVSAQR
jgi:hypothetical protein